MTKGTRADGVVYHAGFPNAGEDQVGLPMGLEQMIVKHRASTYLWRLEQGIVELGWGENSIVVVDRALEARHGDKVVAIIDEEFVVRIFQKTDHVRLLDLRGGAEQSDDIIIWGVVTYVLQAVR
jgi:DNA polymerase V